MNTIRLFIIVFSLALAGCAKEYPNRDPLGLMFPGVTGQSLENKQYRIPEEFSGRSVLLLIGYKQDSQFDIDRWLIGLDMTGTQVEVYELPTIAGMAPRMFKTRINEGMRAGIPKELWKGVITVYADGGLVQSFTGNQNPNNARCVLLNTQGRVVYFYDRGFSVDALNALRRAIDEVG